MKAYFIKNELKKLNRTIDLKIMNGVPYKRDALRHKYLLKELQHSIRSRKKVSWFQRTAQMVTMLMF